MANRGIAVLTDTNYVGGGNVRVSFIFSGVQHGDERAALYVDVAPSLSAATLKSEIKDALATWYGQNPSANYDEWDNTPITGDTLTVAGGGVL